MEEMWDEEDGFFYDDVLRLPNGNATRLKHVRVLEVVA
jgi:hypothetical protein